MEERKNINRGFKKLIIWTDAIDLYVHSNDILINIQTIPIKTKVNCIDTAHSINRNIAEGYCRKSLKEYIRFL
jgi:four helix bundle protein